MFRSGFANPSSYRTAGKADRLLRAAVTSFCAMARPTRRETAQLDDLAVPLLAGASEETLRFVAAALSDSPFAPPALVRRLADLPVGISAPLLMRSPVLSPIDLLALIGRRGGAHARAIAGRTDLDPRILLVIRSLDVLEERPGPSRSDEVRERLRGLMRPAQDNAPGIPQDDPETAMRLHMDGGQDVYRRLRSAALAGAPVLFHTALAEALGIAPAQARAIAGDSDASRLIVALRALPLCEERALLVMQCLHPARDRRAIAAFLDAWQAVSREDAARVVDGWRKAAPAGSAPATAARDVIAS